MKRIIVLAILLLTIQTYGQTSIQTKEISIPYTNGHEVFNICTSGCSTTFDDNKEYFWYTEFSKIKSTKGGSGGNLLHGNYKFYDENGNLRQDKNYYLGLSDGSEKNWDSIGNITSQKKYSKGETIYWKFRNDENRWIEFNGPMFKEGTIRKVYTEYNSLISEDIMLKDFNYRTKIYYEYSGKLKQEYTSRGLGTEYLFGKYNEYYENGKIEVDGQFYDEEYNSIQIGTWKWYKEDGTIERTETYKAEVEKWENGKTKFSGGYIYDMKNNIWVKTGVWKWYTNDGMLDKKKKYEWGIEMND